MRKDIVIFDGECNISNGVIRWLLEFAPEDLFQYMAFQSSYGLKLLKKFGFPTERLETIILKDNNGLKTNSDDFIKIMSKITKWKHTAALLEFIPTLIRDYIYIIASKMELSGLVSQKVVLSILIKMYSVTYYLFLNSTQTYSVLNH